MSSDYLDKLKERLKYFGNELPLTLDIYEQHAKPGLISLKLSRSDRNIKW